MRSDDFTGTCLSCTTPAKNNMVVELIPEVRFSIAEQSEGDVYAPTPGQEGCAVACDIGTTTVVCQLLDLKTGRPILRISGSNSQRIYGGDVLSRLKAAEEGRADEIHGLIIRQIQYYLGVLCREAGIDAGDIRRLAVTGNTIMMHFFAGLDPAKISTAPFEPVSLFGETLSGSDVGLDFDGEVFICPAVSGFIGSDVLCGILASGMAASGEKTLLIDLGTNTELVMGTKDQMTACSADGGAAFRASLLEHGMITSAGAIAGVKCKDGELRLEVLGAAEPKGICGSGFIDLLGILYEEEILDEMGHIADPEETDSPLAKYIGTEEDRTVFYLTEDKKIFISQVDISKFQLAKAAISAGIDVLAEETGIAVTALDKLLLGGGFGAFAHRRHAAVLGLIPEECKGKTEKLGNIALAGAISAALSEEARQELSRIRGLIRVIDLPTHPSFNDAYTEGMIFE
ncbi:MAG: DUF4445 domain-containing protein [Oscillospiraceae bacterium]|nr:DUF4445 domain-containing protein [Oscillospiraceae bacterium]